MKKLRLISNLIAFLFLAVSVNAQTIEEVLQKHEQAMGGSEKWNALKSLTQKTKMSVQGMDISTTINLVVGKSIRSETEVMGNKIIQAYDGKNIWMVRPAMMGGTGKPEDAPSEMTESMESQLYPGSDLIAAKLKGAKIELESKEKVDGVDAFALTVTDKSGKVSNVYVATSSYYIIKTATKQKVNGQEIDYEISYGNYKPVNGLLFPHTMQLPSPMGGGEMTVEVVSVELNPTLDATIFAKPVN